MNKLFLLLLTATAPFSTFCMVMPSGDGSNSRPKSTLKESCRPVKGAAQLGLSSVLLASSLAAGYASLECLKMRITDGWSPNLYEKPGGFIPSLATFIMEGGFGLLFGVITALTLPAGLYLGYRGVHNLKKFYCSRFASNNLRGVPRANRRDD